MTGKELLVKATREYKAKRVQVICEYAESKAQESSMLAELAYEIARMILAIRRA
jgi:hypothetical protein